MDKKFRSVINSTHSIDVYEVDLTEFCNDGVSFEVVEEVCGKYDRAIRVDGESRNTLYAVSYSLADKLGTLWTNDDGDYRVLFNSTTSKREDSHTVVVTESEAEIKGNKLILRVTTITHNYEIQEV